MPKTPNNTRRHVTKLERIASTMSDVMAQHRSIIFYMFCEENKLVHIV